MTEFTLSSKLGKGRAFTVEGVGFAVETTDYDEVVVDGKSFSLADLLKEAGIQMVSSYVAERGEAPKYRIRITVEAEPVE